MSENPNQYGRFINRVVEAEERSISNSAEIREIVSRLEILESTKRKEDRVLTVSDEEVDKFMMAIGISPLRPDKVVVRPALEQFLKDRA